MLYILYFRLAKNVPLGNNNLVSFPGKQSKLASYIYVIDYLVF